MLRIIFLSLLARFICWTWASLVITHHRPPGFSFLGPTLGARMLYWPAYLLGPSGWAPIFKPHQLPPSPCVRTCVGKGCNCSCVSIAISTCRFGLTLITAISQVLIITPWVSRPVFSFLTTSLVSRSSGLLAFYLFGVFALCFLLDFRLLFGAGSFSGECFFFYLIFGPATSPFLRAFSTGFDEVLGFGRRYFVCTVRFVMGSSRSSSLRIDANPPADAGSEQARGGPYSFGRRGVSQCS